MGKFKVKKTVKKSPISKKNSKITKKTQENVKNNRQPKDEAEFLENSYENWLLLEKSTQKPTKPLLPIKTNEKIIAQETVDETEENEESVEENEEMPMEIEEENEETEPVSITNLLVTRSKILNQKKIHIGTLSAGVLENPNEKIMNLKTLVTMMEEENVDIHFTIRKLVIVSLSEIFKDLLPLYEINSANPDNVKLKKDTLKLHNYEKQLVLYYRKYLQNLEKYSDFLKKNKKFSQDEKNLAKLSITVMCELLQTHPYFNYSNNIAKTIVPFLNHSQKEIREIVREKLKILFKEDKKKEITLIVLRLVNNYLKAHNHSVFTDMLDITLVINMKNVDLDYNEKKEIKQKKFNAKKQKILQLSKRDKKRKKQMQQLENEMLETKAEENKKSKQQNLTEITKILFNIYFKILKNNENNKVLNVCLEGLAKFAHCINTEYYIDTVNLLDRLLREDWLGYRERLHCIQTIFKILNGQGDILNVDPHRFYTIFYQDLFKNHLATQENNYTIVAEILNEVLLKRRKKITNKTNMNFVKRLSTVNLQLSHEDCLSNLKLIENILQLNKSADILLDMDSTIGDGNFQPELNDPEYGSVESTALYELNLLLKHYNPEIRQIAKRILHTVREN